MLCIDTDIIQTHSRDTERLTHPMCAYDEFSFIFTNKAIQSPNNLSLYSFYWLRRRQWNTDRKISSSTRSVFRRYIFCCSSFCIMFGVRGEPNCCALHHLLCYIMQFISVLITFAVMYTFQFLCLGVCVCVLITDTFNNSFVYRVVVPVGIVWAASDSRELNLFFFS